MRAAVFLAPLAFLVAGFIAGRSTAPRDDVARLEALLTTCIFQLGDARGER